MNFFIRALALCVTTPIAAVLYASILGLGMHRHGPPWAVSASATAFVFGPSLIAIAFGKQQHRFDIFALITLLWSVGAIAALPLYFPGERAQSVSTGFALLGGGQLDGLAQRLANSLPPEPEFAQQELVLAQPPTPTQVLDPIELAANQIALPYEGKGRRVSVPVAFEHDGRTLEGQMMLDTGATYTTLSAASLKQLGIVVPDNAPTVTLHTANGERTARMVLVDTIWLGDLPVHGVTITLCDTCGTDDNLGLLGLNVTGGYNLLIDADRQEAVFSARADRDRHLDIINFLDLNATFSCFPGGRVEVQVRLHNKSDRAIDRVHTKVSCDGQSWILKSDAIAAHKKRTLTRRLPSHNACEKYAIRLDGAWW